MQKCKLGQSILEVSAIGLGCIGMSWSYGPPNDYVKDGYEASPGNYDVDEQAHTVTHHLEGSITPGLSGNTLPACTSVLTGSSSLNQLGQMNPGRLHGNITDRSANAVTTDDLREIENASSNIKMEGARYPEAMEPMTGL